MHIIGNRIAFPRLHFSGKDTRSIDDLRVMQEEAIRLLEGKVAAGEIKESGALAVVEALRESDWTKKESYENFRRVYDSYVGEVEMEAQALRDRLFGKHE